ELLGEAPEQQVVAELSDPRDRGERAGVREDLPEEPGLRDAADHDRAGHVVAAQRINERLELARLHPGDGMDVVDELGGRLAAMRDGDDVDPAPAGGFGEQHGKAPAARDEADALALAHRHTPRVEAATNATRRSTSGTSPRAVRVRAIASARPTSPWKR